MTNPQLNNVNKHEVKQRMKVLEMWKSNINNKQKHQVYENVKKVFIRKTQKFSFLIRSQKILSRVVNIQVTLKFEPPHMTQQPQPVRGVWPSAVTLILRTDWWSRWISRELHRLHQGKGSRSNAINSRLVKIYANRLSDVLQQLFNLNVCLERVPDYLCKVPAPKNKTK